jgi:hypothetical protein
MWERGAHVLPHTGRDRRRFDMVGYIKTERVGNNARLFPNKPNNYQLN